MGGMYVRPDFFLFKGAVEGGGVAVAVVVMGWDGIGLIGC